MYLSKHKSGYYYVYFNDVFTNQRKSITTKSKLKSDALKFLSKFESELKIRMEQKVEPILLKDFTNKFIIYSAGRHTYKTSKGHKTSLKMLEEYFGNVLLTDLSPYKMKNYIEQRLRRVSAYAARRDLINLSSAFNKAIDDNYLIENPLRNVKRIKIPEKQPKFFTKNEYNRLLSNILDYNLRSLVEIATNTGLRQMELITLKWDQVHFKDRLITLNNREHMTKGKKIRSVPLNLKSLQILTELEDAKECEFVFVRNGTKYTQDYVSKKFKKYVRKANINPQLNFHSLRHTFASWLVQRGVSIYQVSKLLGHADIKTTEIYAHLRAEDLRKSVNLLNHNN